MRYKCSFISFFQLKYKFNGLIVTQANDKVEILQIATTISDVMQKNKELRFNNQRACHGQKNYTIKVNYYQNLFIYYLI